jgi:hypothetical protein
MAHPETAGRKTSAGEAPDEFVPDPVVWKEFGISSMTGWRWSHDPTMIELGFPPATKIRNRNYRNRHLLESFKARLLRRAFKQRGKDESPARTTS